MAKPSPGDTTLNVRVSDDLLERLERHTNQLRQAQPGINISVSDVVRSTLIRGLERGNDDE